MNIMEVLYMNITFENGRWVCDDEYFIIDGLNGYEVYKCEVEDTEQTQALYSSESFEKCLTWIWNS